MKTVYLHGDLGEKFVHKLEVDAKTIPEILWALESNLEGFFAHMLNLKIQGTEYIFFHKNKIDSKEDFLENVVDPTEFEINYNDKEIHLICAIQGGVVFIPAAVAVAGAAAAVVGGIAGALVGGLSAIGGAIGGALGVGGAAGGFSAAGFLKAIAVSVAISFVMQALFKPPDPPKPGVQISTKSYLLSGSQNKTAQGVPIPVGYGRLKVGSAAISTKKHTGFLSRNTQDKKALESFTTIEYLDLICEGPIEGFVNQAGGAINGNDIREGILLNEVPIKNTKKSSSEVESFNFVLNEEEEMPKFVQGNDYENIALDDQVSYVIEYDSLLYGAGPYEQGSAKSEYYSAEEAEKARAKLFTHAIRNEHVDTCIITLATQLMQTKKDDGSTLRNSCRFAILISKNGKPVNVLDLNSGVTEISFRGVDKNQIVLNYSRLRAEQEVVVLQQDSEFAADKATYEKVANHLAKAVSTDGFGDMFNALFFSIPGLKKGFGRHFGITSQDVVVYEKWQNSKYVTQSEIGESSSSSDDSFKLKPKLLERAAAEAFGKLTDSTNVDSSAEANIGLRVEPGGRFFVVEGIATAPYKFDVKIKFNRNENYDSFRGSTTINVIKLSSEYDPAVKDDNGVYDNPGVPESENSSRLNAVGGIGKQRLLQVSDVQERISAKLCYPHCALVKLKFDSKNFGQLPSRAYHLKLKKVLIPSNYDPVSRKYSGPWNGFFKGQTIGGDSVNLIGDDYRYWTDNPAWIFYDLVQNPRYGIGKFGLEEFNIDKWQLYKAAKYCDELVHTGYPAETSTLSPRSFATNNKIVNNTQDSEKGSFRVNFHGNGWYFGENGESVEYTNYSSAEFAKEFGTGEEFKGSKVAFFIYQHNYTDAEMQTTEARVKTRQNSCLRNGEIIIEERILKESNPASKSIVVFGPSFEDISSTFPINGFNRTLGAACLQKSYPMVEPRFTCSTYIHERGQALQVMNNLASVFRGLVGYNFGKILTLQDSKKKPIMLFNNSNIDVEDGFTYSGMDKNKRFTAVIVRFNNANKNYAPDLVYEEDNAAMKIYGYQEKEIMGLGTTSESQARRLARWVLFSSQLETEKISFKTSEEGSYLYPGAIFEVSDENRAGKNMSGRILDVSNLGDGSPYVLLDKSGYEFVSIDKVELTINVGLPYITPEIIEGRAASHKSQEDQDSEIENVSSIQTLKFQGNIVSLAHLKNMGPQGQKTIVTELMLKVPFAIDTSKNLIKAFSHGLENNDRIRFTSAGALPAGINEDRFADSAYYVINASLHSFQISLSSGGSPVGIYNVGRDQFGNQGGLHYFIVENQAESLAALNQKYIDQIEIGSAYSVQGLFGSEITSAVNYSGSELENLFIYNDVSAQSGWYYSNMFGSINISKNDYHYVLGLGWVYFKEMNYPRSNDSEFFWFHIQGVGWVSTNEKLFNSYWYLKDMEKWIYVKYLSTEDSSAEPMLYYLFDSSHGKTVGSKLSFKQGNTVPVLRTDSQGFWFSFNQNRDNPLIEDFLVETPDSISDSLTVEDLRGNSSYYETEIAGFSFISADDNFINNQNAVRVSFADGHGLDFLRNTSIKIRGCSLSAMNSNWQIVFISQNEIQLLDSSSVYSSGNGSTISSLGTIEYIESVKSKSLRYFQSQLFRVLGVKEVEDRKYEVQGIEYSESKFDSVDKDMAVTIPALPIPPQADMSLPVAPTNLELTDLTI